MHPIGEGGDWQSLHLRRARGETLTPEEQRRYDEEMERQDRTAPPLRTNLDRLKLLRQEFIRLSQENSQLRIQLARLEDERTRVERALSPETRLLLGVGE
jgi:hypothetical protein